jgi:hypothetical protein
MRRREAAVFDGREPLEQLRNVDERSSAGGLSWRFDASKQ